MDGHIPTKEERSWERYNNHRQNVMFRDQWALGTGEQEQARDSLALASGGGAG